MWFSRVWNTSTFSRNSEKYVTKPRNQHKRQRYKGKHSAFFRQRNKNLFWCCMHIITVYVINALISEVWVWKFNLSSDRFSLIMPYIICYMHKCMNYFSHILQEIPGVKLIFPRDLRNLWENAVSCRVSDEIDVSISVCYQLHW